MTLRAIFVKLLELAESEARGRGSPHLDLYTHECMTEASRCTRRSAGVKPGAGRREAIEGVYLRKMLC